MSTCSRPRPSTRQVKPVMLSRSILDNYFTFISTRTTRLSYHLTRERTSGQSYDPTLTMRKRSPFLTVACPANFLSPNYLLLYHFVKFLNTISWKDKSQPNGRKVLASVFCGIIDLGEVKTKLLIGSYQDIFCPLYQDNDKNEFWLEEERGKRTTSWSVRAMSSGDDSDAPFA